MLKQNVSTYAEYVLRNRGAPSAGTTKGQSSVLFGHRAAVVGNDCVQEDHSTMQLGDQENWVAKRIDQHRIHNKAIIRR